jgi:hypothetical protein
MTLCSVHLREIWVKINIGHITLSSILIVVLARLGFGDWQTAFAAGSLVVEVANTRQIRIVVSVGRYFGC